MTRPELLEVAKPILFNTEMVKAILDDSKSVTRRVIKYKNNCHSNYTIDDFIGSGDPQLLVSCSTYQVGDILYVRETWCIDEQMPYDNYIYRADDEIPQGWRLTSWKPSIHMSKEAARIFLRITGVRVERLQDISSEQCTKEGMTEKQKSVLNKEEYWYWYSELWNSTIKKFDLDKYGWKANPYVWVIKFERIGAE